MLHRLQGWEKWAVDKAKKCALGGEVSAKLLEGNDQPEWRRFSYQTGETRSHLVSGSGCRWCRWCGGVAASQLDGALRGMDRGHTQSGR